jgi:hypothetical protein
MVVVAGRTLEVLTLAIFLAKLKMHWNRSANITTTNILFIIMINNNLINFKVLK